MTALRFETANEAETEALGRRLAPALKSVRLLCVRGAIGAGKTTFVRGLLRGLGHEGPVKSPTFTLVEPYPSGDISLCHFDFYRLEDPAELEFVGLRDYLQSDTVCVVEWPERAGALLPRPDLDVMIRSTNTKGRDVQLQALSEAGEAALDVFR